METLIAAMKNTIGIDKSILCLYNCYIKLYLKIQII